MIYLSFLSSCRHLQPTAPSWHYQWRRYRLRLRQRSYLWLDRDVLNYFTFYIASLHLDFMRNDQLSGSHFTAWKPSCTLCSQRLMITGRLISGLKLGNPKRVIHTEITLLSTFTSLEIRGRCLSSKTGYERQWYSIFSLILHLQYHYTSYHLILSEL